MQEFLTNNTVNCNLMSLTGYRTLIILKALMESSKSQDEINEYFLRNQYIKEKFSNDTLRIYINSLREIGCEIVAANKSNSKKYELISHPFLYDIPKMQLKAISKLYKDIYDKIDIEDVLAIEKFFDKLCGLIKNENTKEILKNCSVLKNINPNILKELMVHCKNKSQIKILYNSPKSKEKEIEIIVDKLSFKSDKLYLWGTNLTHKEYSYFQVERILKISQIKFSKSNEVYPSIKLIYELYNHNGDYIPTSDEKIIEKTDEKLIIEVNTKNEFNLMQRLLYMATDCKIINPPLFKTKLLNKLKAMEEYYEGI